MTEAQDPDLRARIQLRLAGEPDQLGYAASIANADAAVAELEAVDRSAVDRDLLACALLQSAQLRFEAGLGNHTAAIERATSLLADQPRRAADGDLRPESLRAHAISWQWAADHDDFATALAGALADIGRARDYGMDRPLAIGEAEVAYLCAWSGDLASAGDHAQAALDAADVVGTRESRSAALCAVGVVALLGGDLDAAEEAARAGLVLAADPADWLDARHEVNMGAVALVRGHAAEAAGILGPLFDRLVGLGARESNHRFAGDLVEAAVLAGDLARARGVLEVIEGSARIVPRPWVMVMAARGRAQVHAAEGDLDAADLEVGAALAAAADLPMPVERARTELIAGRIARRRKERRRAAEHLERAAESFRSVGATAWVAIAEDDMARLGRRRGGGDTLTETEDRVARLAAGGLTNREVGEAAFLTAKSVEGVLARVYGKLGIGSRAELGAWLAEQGGAGREG
ncbi:MAG: helix-turn-helix transcriptional regulator [Chloroflexi bacterium]|nr:helix-turn-helix transcriptional regulator [Chloroflexota bacterium]